MTCLQCGADNPAAARFCVACAVSLGPACGLCGTALPDRARYCPGCGRPAAENTTPPRFGAPDTYTPRRLAERILTSRGAVEGERKQVTVLFADLKGSMELVAERDPEVARKLMDPVLESMMEAVYRYEGTVNQVMGDGIMALFGAPLAHEDHAVRACYAALRMQESMKKYAEAVRREHGIGVQMRVGLNSGEVVVRSIGSDLHMDYTAVGFTTHLAGRLEQVAAPGTTLMSAGTLALAEGFVEARPLGPVAFRGIKEPVEVYELVGVGSLRSAFQRAAARGFTPFVGRDRELGVLRRAAAEAFRGRGRVVAVVGEPGVGKSRLLWELARSLEGEGWLVLEGRCLSYGRSSAYLPIVDMLRPFFKIDVSDDGATRRSKVISRVLELDPALGPYLAPLEALLDAPVEDPRWQQLDPVERRRQTMDVVRRLLWRESQERPVLVAVDDLHWVDAESQAFFDAVAHGVNAARVLLLTGYRSDYEPPWGERAHGEKLWLEPLSTEGVDLLLDALLGDDPGLGALRRLLVERTEGNPFFLEESVAMLMAEGTLVGGPGRYRLAKVPVAIRIPQTVHAVLAARIDQLAPEDKALLEAAAVIGRDVALGLLQAVADLPDEDLHAGLARLQAAEFLYEVRLFPEIEYVFKHPLTHEIAYGALVQDRRRATHARVVAALERQDRARLDERVGTLAYHAFHGGLWEKAVTWLRQAGAKAALRSASTEAVACFEQALEAIAHLAPTRANVERAIDLRFDLRNPLFLLAEFPRALEVLEEVPRLAESLDESERLGRALSYMANVHFMLGNVERGIGLAKRALAIGEKIRNPALLAFTWCHLGQLHYVKGEHAAGVAAMARCLDCLGTEVVGRRQNVVHLYSVVAHCFVALAQATLGLFPESLAAGERCREIADQTDAPFYRALALWAVGHAHLARGDVEQAAALLDRAREDCDRADIRSIRPWIAADLGLARLLTGGVGEATAILEDAVGQAASLHLFSAQSLRFARLGEAYLRSARRGEAAHAAARALELAVEHGEQGFRAWALRLHGEIALEDGDVPAARAYLGEALALAAELGMRPLVARCHLDMAVLQFRAGERREAERGLGTATAMFSEMSMRFWLQRAEALWAAATAESKPAG